MYPVLISSIQQKNSALIGLQQQFTKRNYKKIKKKKQIIMKKGRITNNLINRIERLFLTPFFLQLFSLAYTVKNHLTSFVN